MRLTSALVILAASVPLVFADPEFTFPTAGVSVAAGEDITITWQDTGNAPAIADLVSYQIFLFSGANSNPQQLYQVATGAFTSGNTATGNIPVGIGGSGTNAYFLGILSIAADGSIWDYSNRFTLTGMTGTFSAVVQAALADVVGTDGPASVNHIVAAGAAAAATTADAGVYGIPYNEQTGTIKYAPMQPVPPTAITATNTSPLWPTSSVSLATTFLPTPSVVTTSTEAQTFAVSSHANTAAAASQPTDDMQRFLNRWKD